MHYDKGSSNRSLSIASLSVISLEKESTSKIVTAVFLATILLGVLALSLILSTLGQGVGVYSIPSTGILRYPYALPLHVEGRYIKNSDGDIVYLRGIHKHAFLAPPHTGQWIPEGGTRHQAYDEVWDVDRVIYNLDMMQQFGFSALRMFMPPVVVWQENRDGVRERVATVISLAQTRGIYIIPVFYTVGEGFGQTPIPWDPYTKESERGIFVTAQDYIDFMLEFTDYYNSYPNVIYEFWNEPHGPAHLEYFNICQDLLTQMRARGNEHLIIYQFGYTGWESNTEVANGRILNGTNVVYSTHAYRNLVGGPTSYWGTTGEYNYSDVRHVLMDNLAMSNLIDANLTAGIFEAGCNVRVTPQSEEVQAFANMLQIANEEGWSYTPLQWWDDIHAFGIFEDSLTYPWLPPPNDGGQALIDAVANGAV